MHQKINYNKIIKQSTEIHEVRESFFDDVRISVFVLCFNHKKYLSRFFESALSQRVNCGVEIIINDDCSTDGSQSIIIEYQKRYPKIIKPIFRKKNLYLTDREKKFYDFMELAKGSYFAFCESDDYFTDPYKLLIQSHILSNNQNVDFCTHKVERFDLRINQLVGFIPAKRINISRFNITKIADLLYYGGPFHFSSYFCRAVCFQEFLKVARELQSIASFSDVSILLFCSRKKGLYYIDRIMSRYHFFVKNSWTARTYSNDPLKKSLFFDMNADYYCYISHKFEGKTKKILKDISTKNRMLSLKLKQEYDIILSNRELRKELKRYSKRDYIALYFKTRFPKFYRFIKKK